MLQERDARPPRADGDAQGRPSPGTASWEVTDAQVSFTSGRVDSATTLQNPKDIESTIGRFNATREPFPATPGRLR